MNLIQPPQSESLIDRNARERERLSMARIIFRKLHINDFDKSLDLFNGNLFHINPTTLYFHYILDVALSLFGSDTFIGSVAQTRERKIVGTIIARRYPLGKSWVIGPVLVHSKFRNLGIGTHMMNSVMKRLREKKAKSVILSVERDNVAGRSFFEKFGFRYLEPVFTNHDRARNYARTTALIQGYRQNPSCKITQYSSRRKKDFSQIEKTRMWHIMLKEPV